MGADKQGLSAPRTPMSWVCAPAWRPSECVGCFVVTLLLTSLCLGLCSCASCMQELEIGSLDFHNDKALSEDRKFTLIQKCNAALRHLGNSGLKNHYEEVGVMKTNFRACNSTMIPEVT